MSESEVAEQAGGITRRRVMGVFGGGAIGAIALPRVPRGWQRSEPGSALMSAAATPTFTATVTRREDMLQLTFEFWNLHLESAPSGVVLAPVDPSAQSVLVAVFGPQAVGEEVFGEPSPAPIEAELSGPTRLAFFVPNSVQLRYVMSDLLSWAQLHPSLQIKVPTPPEPLATVIEAPWHLFLTPDKSGGWNHSTTPVTVDKRTELWHTRLGARRTEPPAALPRLVAMWTPGYPAELPADPFTMSLQNIDRRDIVTNTITQAPAVAELFMLSALGASIRVGGDWPSASTTSLIAWKHRTALGRDSYVRTVRSGFVFPFRNRAVKISITDRELQPDNGAQPVTRAYLIQRTYVFITQPTISYDDDQNEPFAGRQNPLRSVTFTTLSTPTLGPDADLVVSSTVSTNQAIWVRDENGANIPFAVIATDREQRQVTMHVPLIWVDDQEVLNGTVIDGVMSAYQADTDSIVELNSQLLAMAEPDQAKPGATAHHVETLALVGVPAVSPQEATPNWYPAFVNARIHLPGLAQLAGSKLDAPQMQVYGYNGGNTATGYLANGFNMPGNPEVYLQLADDGQAGPGLHFPPQRTGGTATPNFTISGIARDLGPVGGNLDNLAQAGSFDPSDFFQTSPQFAAKLLGAINLADIIMPLTGPGAGAQAPTISTQTIVDGTTGQPSAIQTTMNWTPAVRADGAGFFIPVIGQATGNTALTIHVKINTPIADPSQTSYEIHGQLTNFSLQLFGSATPLITVGFDQLDFTSATGAKTSIVPKVRSVDFSGPLLFLNDLKSLLTALGGPSIDVEPALITAGYSLAIPSVGIGVFGLKNLKLGTALTIPFDGTPVRLRFDLSTRDDPFILSLSLFAGGGFFGLAIGADGVEKLEISLEFGAAASLDIGVASGSISIMAGIYFSLQTNPDQVNLTGFLRADGSLSVLGIVTISVEFYLGLTYLSKGKAYGEAMVTVSVSVFCFSQSVTMTMQKQIGGSGDPTFSDAIKQLDWATYCAAFA